MTKGLFDIPSSVKSLRRYWKSRALPDIERLGQEIIGESDRSAVILLATLLDDALTFAINQKLAFQPDEKQFEHIFRYEGPLGSFSARTEVAYLFGIIEEGTAEQLFYIREMRNACAHSKHPVSFSDSALVNVAQNIFRPRGLVEPEGKTAKEIRQAFTVECIILFNILIYGSRAAGVAAVNDGLRESLAALAPSPDKLPER